MESATTAVSCIKEKRNYIGFEINNNDNGKNIIEIHLKTSLDNDLKK